MQIAGIQKLTLVDFPGHVAATVFTRGCSFRCGFCHNPELVIPEKFTGDLILEEDFFNFLLSRVGKIGGICITGGEPLLQPDIDQFISHIKALGFKVKLDTNGSFPDRLQEIIKEGDIDYIAMDIKSPLDKYQAVTTPNLKPQISKLQLKTTKHKTSKSEELEVVIKRSIDLIMSSEIDYEFRTTVCHPYHEVKDFSKIGQMIKGAKLYYIQNFVRSKHINPDLEFEPFSTEELKKSVKEVEKFVKKVDIR